MDSCSTIVYSTRCVTESYTGVFVVELYNQWQSLNTSVNTAAKAAIKILGTINTTDQLCDVSPQIAIHTGQ